MQPGTLASANVPARCVLGTPNVTPAQVRRLAELGLRAGAAVTVLFRTAGGGRVIGIGESRIALDRATLAAIPVLTTSAAEPTR